MAVGVEGEGGEREPEVLENNGVYRASKSVSQNIVSHMQAQKPGRNSR